MNEDWLISIVLAGSFLGLFAIAEFIHLVFKVQAEYTRKLVHVVTGVLTLLFPVYFNELWPVVLLCVAFLLLLLLSKRYLFLKSINAIERSSSGSTLYPLIVVVIFYYYLEMRDMSVSLHPYAYFYVPMLLMAICDPVAALAGAAWKRRNLSRPGKTLAGTMAFGIAAFITSLILISIFAEGDWPVWAVVAVSLGLSVTTAVAERLTGGGWDNFTIPSVAAAVLYLFTQVNL